MKSRIAIGSLTLLLLGLFGSVAQAQEPDAPATQAPSTEAPSEDRREGERGDGERGDCPRDGNEAEAEATASRA